LSVEIVLAVFFYVVPTFFTALVSRSKCTKSKTCRKLTLITSLSLKSKFNSSSINAFILLLPFLFIDKTQKGL